jgi:hypothetical protein
MRSFLRAGWRLLALLVVWSDQLCGVGSAAAASNSEREGVLKFTDATQYDHLACLVHPMQLCTPEGEINEVEVRGSRVTIFYGMEGGKTTFRVDRQEQDRLFIHVKGHADRKAVLTLDGERAVYEGVALGPDASSETIRVELISLEAAGARWKPLADRFLPGGRCAVLGSVHAPEHPTFCLNTPNHLPPGSNKATNSDGMVSSYGTTKSDWWPDAK